MLRIFRHYVSASALGLFLCESLTIVFVLYAAVYIVTSARTGSDGANFPVAGAVLLPTALISILMYCFGLYDKSLITDFRRSLPRLAVLFALCVPVVVVSINLARPLPSNPSASDTPTIVLGLWAAVALGGVVVARFSYALVTRAAFVPRRVLVIGAGKLAAELEYLSQRQRGSCTIAGYVRLSDDPLLVPEARVKPITTSLLNLAREVGVNEIVVALDDRRGVSLQPLLEARLEGVTITSYLAFWERETRRVNLNGLDPSWLIYSDGFRIGTAMNGAVKRLLDIVASLGLLLFTLPTLLLVAIAIRLDSRGPILYRQDRVGRNGVPFKIYKFRTMRVDAESDGIPQWASLKDTRTTRVGSFLRVTRIDELPQILNVLRGDMSFVGPRPERPFFVQSLSRDLPFYSERHRVRPGITGWAQINYPYGASIEDAKAKLAYDLYYIKNYSIFFDVLIILSTAHAVFANRGGR